MFQIKICSTHDELQELAQLAKEIWNSYFPGIISKEQIDYMVDKYQSLPALTKAVKQEGYTYFLGYEEKKLVGYCGVKDEEKRLFLSKLYIHKTSRGKGYSSLLLNRAIDFAKKKNLQSIYLTCNKQNVNSLHIYKYKHFSIIDDRKTDIGNGFIMDDYVMELTI